MQALSHTAIRMQLDDGDHLGDRIEEMQSFLDSKEGAKITKYRLGMLRELPVVWRTDEEEEIEAHVPDRKSIYNSCRFSLPSN